MSRVGEKSGSAVERTGMRESGSFGYPSGARYGIYTAYAIRGGDETTNVLKCQNIIKTHMRGMETIAMEKHFRSVYDCFRKFIIRRTPGSVALTENDIWYWVQYQLRPRTEPYDTTEYMMTALRAERQRLESRTSGDR